MTLYTKRSGNQISLNDGFEIATKKKDCVCLPAIKPQIVVNGDNRSRSKLGDGRLNVFLVLIFDGRNVRRKYIRGARLFLQSFFSEVWCMRAPTAVHLHYYDSVGVVGVKEKLLVFVDGTKIFWDDEGWREVMRF